MSTDNLTVYNSPPYYDDYNEANNYLRILFRPGYSVQARELTQMQTALQAQIARFGSHVFVDGSPVIGGLATLNSNYAYVQLSSTGNPDTHIASFVGTTVTGATTGVTATVVGYATSVSSDPTTLYVQYTNSGTNNTTQTFQAGESISNGTYTYTVRATTPTGLGAAVSIAEGVFFVNGCFVYAPASTLIVSKYSNKPSGRLMYVVTENIVTSAQDTSLTDNALGTPNLAAPGANRYQIDLTLSWQPLSWTSQTQTKCIQLLVINNGAVANSASTTYNDLAAALAQRTYEEAGNYTVNPFLATVSPYLNTGSNGGVYTWQQIVGNDLTGTYTNQTLATNYGNSVIAFGLEASTAYVKGYRIQTLNTTWLPIATARSLGYDHGASLLAAMGNYFTVNTVVGMPDVNTLSAVALKNSGGTQIGSCRIRSTDYVSGTAGTSGAVYAVYIMDLAMNAGHQISETATLQSTVPSGHQFTASVVSNTIQDTGDNCLVYPLPVGVVSTLRGTGGAINTYYYVRKEYGPITSSSSSGNTILVLTAQTNEIWSSTLVTDYIVTDDTSGGVLTAVTAVTLSGGLSTCTLTITGTVGHNFYITAPSRRNFREKSKTLNTGVTLTIASPNTTPAGYDSLYYTDVTAVAQVWTTATTGTAPGTYSGGVLSNGTNITSNYVLATGQTDNFYGVSSLQLIPGAVPPTGQLFVVLSYFSHGSGDYFSVDSYSGISYSAIPTYQSTQQGLVQLRDCIDFRPSKTYSTTISAYGGSDNYTGTGASTIAVPLPYSIFTADIQYYLARIDKIALDAVGNFNVIQGVSSLTPTPPADPDGQMVLYTLAVAPYTFGPRDIHPTMVDNKGYTMRAIGNLDSRISTLEYYTALSTLEQAAATAQVFDSGGTQAFNNGFIVDPFIGTNIADVTNSDLACSMDKSTGTCRPMFVEDNTKLFFNAGSSTGYAQTGSVLSLQYYPISYISQPYASLAMNVNPFNVFNWTGQIILSPASDEWKETDVAPTVTIDQTGIYDAITTNATPSASVGTVWNEWQINWAGVASSTNTTSGLNAVEAAVLGSFGTVATTTSTTTGQSQTGVQSSVTPDTVTMNLGNSVVEVNYAPFIRSRMISFWATGLKPNTQVYAFFDGTSVASYVKQVSTFVQYANNSTTQTDYLGATGYPGGSSTLITDSSGSIIGSFVIPNVSPSLQFNTGSRIFRLTDSVNNSQVTGAATTWAEATYVAQGLIETVQAQVVTASVSQSGVISNSTSGSTVSGNLYQPPQSQSNPASNGVAVTTPSTQPTIPNSYESQVPTLDPGGSGFGQVVYPGWGEQRNQVYLDPLAQAFLVDMPGGIVATSVDLFFSAKDANLPVTIQIRTMENGYPTQTYLPNSQVTMPASGVNVDATAAIATTFVFPAPVPLAEGTQYAIVVMTNSNNYQVYVANLGDYDITNPSYRIVNQPYAGAFFESKNASTWQADQTKDLKFNLNRAVFSVATNATVTLNEVPLNLQALAPNPVYTTNGSTTVRIFQQNHGLFAGTSHVTLSGIQPTASSALNGIPITQLNTTLQVQTVEQDSYTVTVSTSATATGLAGGAVAYATQQLIFDVFQPQIQDLIPSGSGISWAVTTTTAQSLAGSETPYIVGASGPVLVNDNNTMAHPGVVVAAPNVSALSSGSYSFTLTGTLSTTQNNVSPMIDLDRCSLITIANRIDNPAASSATGFNVVHSYVAETNPIGCSNLARYVSRVAPLNTAAESLKIYLSVNCPASAYVDVYYQLLPVGASDTNIRDAAWNLVLPDSAIQITNDPTNYAEVSYTVNETELQTLYSTSGVVQYTAFSVKIVLRSSNSSTPPTVRNFRAIATT